jgi:hypothetical protein
MNCIKCRKTHLEVYTPNCSTLFYVYILYVLCSFLCYCHPETRYSKYTQGIITFFCFLLCVYRSLKNHCTLHLYKNHFFLPRSSRFWSIGLSFLSFLIRDSRQESLDGWSARRKASTCTQTQKHAHTYTNTKHPCPEWELKLRSPVSERAKTVHALDRSATVTGTKTIPSLISIDPCERAY